LAQYTFNDGTSKDVTGNGYDGVLLGNAVIVADAERGQVLQVNQSGMQADGPFAITTSFTLSAWVKLDVPRTGRYYFGGPWWFRTDNQGDPEHYWIEIRYPEGNFLNKIDTRTSDNPSGQLDGQWHHLVLILPEDGAFKGYFDGVVAPFRDANPVRIHDFGGSISPLFFGTQNESGGNAISGYMDDIRVYNYALSEEEIPGLMIEGLGSDYAHTPNPANEATDVPRDVILGWQPGEFAVKHDVYFGSVFEDVNEASRANPRGVLVRQGQDDNMYDPDLEFGQTYYWRIDEVSAPPDNTIFTGEVWSFTVEPYAYPIENITAVESSSNAPEQVPENTTNGSGLDESGLLHGNYSAGTMWLSSLTGDQPSWITYEFDQSYKLHEMWVWNYNESWEQSIGAGIKDATIEYSVDDSNYSTLGTTHEFNQGPGTADYAHNTTVNLEGVTAKHVKLTANSNWGEGILNQYGLSEVRFFYIPVKAREPNPDSGATDVDVDVTLGWRSGREATSHEVYIGSDMNTLSLVDTVPRNHYDTEPLDLQLGETYYWQINEVNDMDALLSEGDIWSFNTADFIVIEDFEDYDVGNKEIWWFWKDGLGYAAVDGRPAYPGNGTGSAVGDETSPSYMEETIVHGGRKSMPMVFNNTVAAYSETELTFDIPMDWIRAGIQTLVLHFYEDPGNTGGQLYVKVNGERVDYTEDPGAARPPEWVSWQQWNIDLVDFESKGIDLANVSTLAIGIDGIGVTGKFYFDDILLYKSAPPAPKVLTWFEAESGTITAPMLVYMGDPTASGGHYIGTEETLGDENANPPADGIATYNFTVPGGTYKVVLRIVATSGSDTFWIRIPTATTNTNNHASGWVLFGQPEHSDDWQWTEVSSRDDDSRVVEFTLTAGTHTLEVARREDGALLDAVAFVSLTD
jgi:hypothetical protein